MAGESPAAADTASQEPERLWLVAPRGAGLQGEYTKQRGRDKHGQAIWRQVNGSGWLFSSGPKGFWCFAKKESDIGKKLGQVQSASPHQGSAPHEMLQWQYHDWSTWRDDESIKVTALLEEFKRATQEQELTCGVCAKGDRLWIVAPPYGSLQGEYAKEPGRIERGQPVWRQVNGNGALFSTAKGRWFIADGEAGIKMNGGLLATAAHHDGRPPQDIKQWQYFHEGKWHADPAIFATEQQEEGEKHLADQEAQALERASSAPARLWLVCLPKPGLQGEYARHQDRVERGEAVWQQVDGNGVLYSNGLGGVWCFANKETDIMKNVGFIQSTSPHNGKHPQEVGCWQYADGSTWKQDNSIIVTAYQEEGLRAFAEQHAEALRRAAMAPDSLWLIAPAQPQLQGEYAKQCGRVERGQACWRQAAGQGWLYSTSGGRWFVADREDAIAVCGGVIASIAPHGGLGPQECKSWQIYEDSTWQADPSIILTDSRATFDGAAGPAQAEEVGEVLEAPERLWLVAPSVPRLQGEYAREDAASRPGPAAWRRVGGAGWLYRDVAAGRWCFAEQESDMEVSRALLRSSNLQMADLPHEVEKWQMAEELNNTEDLVWTVEPSICVLTSAEEARRALEAAAAAPLPAAPEGGACGGAPATPEPPEVAGAGQVPTPRTARVVCPESPRRAGGEGSPAVKRLAVEVPPLPQLRSLDACNRPELKARIRAEVQSLLAIAGLSRADSLRSMDLDVLVDECISSLEEEGSAAAEDCEAVRRAVLRSLLTGWSQGRSVTQLAQVPPNEGCEDDDIPQLFCSCQPQSSRARRHFFTGLPPHDLGPDACQLPEQEEIGICHQGCPDPCMAGGRCTIS